MEVVCTEAASTEVTCTVVPVKLVEEDEKNLFRTLFFLGVVC